MMGTLKFTTNTPRYKEAMKRHRRTAFQRRDVKTEITVFRIVEQKGCCGSFIPRYKIGLDHTTTE